MLLQPLIDELKLLWYEGVLTYDISTKNNFMIKDALLWIINDFSTYEMLSNLMTSGRLACLYYMEKLKPLILSMVERRHFLNVTCNSC